MPNGNPDFYEKEFPEYEAFFAPVAHSLRSFSSKHNLMLDRYYHESPSWRFNFRHPKGGVSSLDVIKESESSVKIGLYWWIDDYDNFTRFVRSDETPSFEVTNADLIPILEEQFSKVLSWELGDWTTIATGYEQI